MGGSSYIDSVILRDRDANTAWTAASDGTLEERRYLVQNWRADVTTMLNTSGEPIEWYRYSAYGQPTSHPITDINGDGSVTSADTAAWLDVQAGDSSGSVWLTDDLNRDDVFPGDTADDTFFYAQQTAASGLSSGYDRQSAYGLRKGYAGYEWDDTLTMWQVRHRVLDSKSGKWTKRDPLGYVDGVSDVEYVVSKPLRRQDPTGTRSAHGATKPKPPVTTPIDEIEQVWPDVRPDTLPPQALPIPSGDPNRPIGPWRRPKRPQYNDRYFIDGTVDCDYDWSETTTTCTRTYQLCRRWIRDDGGLYDPLWPHPATDVFVCTTLTVTCTGRPVWPDTWFRECNPVIPDKYVTDPVCPSCPPPADIWYPGIDGGIKPVFPDELPLPIPGAPFIRKCITWVFGECINEFAQ